MITIRKAQMEDIHLLTELWECMMVFHEDMLSKYPDIKHLIFNRKKDSHNIIKPRIEKHIKSRNSLVCIAEVDNKPAGYSLSYIKDNFPIFKEKKIGYLSDLFVGENFRRLGIASKLKDETLKWFKGRGITFISLKTFKNNDIARSTYEKWGFTEFDVNMWIKI